LAVAFQLLRTLPHLKVALLEKETRLARGQTGRLAGVLQSGLWSGSGVGPELCREGRLAFERFCDEEGIPWKRSGKLVVATGEEEQWLRQLEANAETLKLSSEWCGTERLREIMPALSAAAGLFLPGAGMVDYAQICERLAHRIHQMGGEFFGGAEVITLRQNGASVQVESTAGEFEGKVLFNCAGLCADDLARRAGADPGIWLVPFRAEYVELDAEGRSLIKLPVYRVPRPGALFGGLRLVPTVDGRVECGPGIRPAIARDERPDWWKAWRNLAAQVNEPGFVPMLQREWRDAVRHAWRRCQGDGVIQETRTLFPGLAAWNFDEAQSGRFARALRPDGKFTDDLCVIRAGRMLHVCHVPEAGGTAALSLAKGLVGQAVVHLVA
jgi:L-2-hydroxyglutarate oxidase